MNLVIPPIFFYVIGALLIIFGAARALTLGRHRPGADIQDDDSSGNPSNEAGGAPARARTRRRHLAFGIIWIGMGIFLIVSTAVVLKVRSPF
jgi:cytochrome oxidase assembly protein ShyY1